METRMIDFPSNPDLEDDSGNEYFTCPFCEGSIVVCRGDCIDVGFGPTYQIAPDILCQICDETGAIKVGSEAHYFCLSHAILEIIQESFGEDLIDNLPEKKFKGFHKSLQNMFNILKPIWLQENPNG